ncbi:DUF6894 family protein [Methylobacterium sp. J-076]|uniref:DUF6894 family protein n=1 Tax=Methylobacterium sp. J-076 TaxID=2836655 RepID=UPI001FBB317F|nr:catalase [Methylobacterium sp. J-076]MCJ2011075.1 catalase [Methylobacterium sp. J-076]
MRAFFNILVNGTVVPDQVGQEIVDAEGLRAAASTVVRALIQRHGGEAQLLDASLLVTDVAGASLMEISFFEALYLPVTPVADSDRRKPAARPERPSAFLDAALRPMRRFAGAVSARVQAFGQV